MPYLVVNAVERCIENAAHSSNSAEKEKEREKKRERDKSIEEKRLDGEKSNMKI